MYYNDWVFLFFLLSSPPVLSTIQHVPDHQGPAGAADTDLAGQHPVAAGGAPEDTGAALPGPRLQCTGALLLEGAESSILSLMWLLIGLAT